jgi:hypothetical protein
MEETRAIHARRAPVAEADLEAAREVLGDELASRATPARKIVVQLPIILLAMLSIPALLLAPLLRGGLLLRLTGIAVQTVHGDPAGRVRCLGRALIAWSPCLSFAVILLIALLVGVPIPGGEAGRIVMALALSGIALAGAVSAVARPERGLADRLAGTFLVPR